MQRRFNYTNRKRIKKNDLSFTIVEDEIGQPKFHAGNDPANASHPSFHMSSSSGSAHG